jgi:hypothetical protein
LYFIKIAFDRLLDTIFAGTSAGYSGNGGPAAKQYLSIFAS